MINNQKKILTAWIDENRNDDMVNVDCDEENFGVAHGFIVLDTMVDFLLERGYTVQDVKKFIYDGRCEEENKPKM